jgi:uncharacterized membrane protein YcaP (DUF421 family)
MDPSFPVSPAASQTLPAMLLHLVVIYFAALLIVRVSGDLRMFGNHAAFDVILGIIFGSLMSRAINGSAPFLETIVLGAVLVGVHWLLAVASFHSHRFGKVLKGVPRSLVSAGRIDWRPMRRSLITEQDLLEAMRLRGIPALDEVSLATLERNGQISAVPRPLGRILEVRVEPGVETVRIELV